MKKMLIALISLVLLIGITGVVYANSQDIWRYYVEYTDIELNCSEFGFGDFDIFYRAEYNGMRIYYYNKDGLVYKSRNQATGRIILFSPTYPEKEVSGPLGWNWFWEFETPGQFYPIKSVKNTGTKPVIQIPGEGNFYHAAGLIIYEDPDVNPQLVKIAGLWFEDEDFYRLCEYFAE